MLERKFTWCNSQADEKWSRIDRFLLSPEWMNKFNFKLWGLPRRVSDHCPILLMEDERDWSPKPFKFINAWTLHPSFFAFVEKVWNETIVEGWSGFKCLRKFKALKLALKQWNVEVFGNVESKLKLLEEELHVLELKVEESSLSESDFTRIRDAKWEAWKLSRMVEWVQSELGIKRR
ncbi:hypothetical protein ACSBR2_025985 [Camellia fascicularis]